MNYLSKDDFIKILGFLPSNETTRFTRLSKRIGSVITSNPKIFSRPMISLGVEHHHFDWKVTLGYINIKMAKGDISAVVYKDGTMGVEFSPLADKFIEPFADAAVAGSSGAREGADSEATSVKLDEFLIWIFGKFDLESMQVKRGGYLTNKVMEKINASTCRCFKIQLEDKQTLNEPRQLDKHLLLDFSKRQEELGVSTKITADPYSYSLLFLDFSYLKLCCDLFNVISTTINIKSFVDTIYSTLRHWRGNQYTQGKLRFHFDCSVKLDRYRISGALRMTQMVGVKLVGFEEKDYERVLQCPRLKNVPKLWDFKDVSTERILRFYFTKEGNVLVVTAEILPID